MKRTLVIIATIFAGLSIGLFACAGTQNKTKTEESPNKNAIDYLETAETGGAGDKVPDPNAPKLEVISVYVPNEDKTKLTKELDSIETLDASLLFDKLKEYNVVPEQSTLAGFSIEGKTAQVQISGVNLSDELITEAIMNSFMENFELDSVSIRSVD